MHALVPRSESAGTPFATPGPGAPTGAMSPGLGTRATGGQVGTGRAGGGGAMSQETRNVSGYCATLELGLGVKGSSVCIDGYGDAHSHSTVAMKFIVLR